MARQKSSAPDERPPGTCYRVRDIPPRLRPREEMERVGAEGVSDAVLLAIILRAGIHGTNVIDLARDILNRYRSLTALAGASVEELQSIKGIKKVKAQILIAALELAKRLSQEQLGEQKAVRTPGDAAALLEQRARVLDREVFWILPLDARNRVKKDPVEVSRGLLDASLVHPREVFKMAIATNSAAIVLVHNHPSGDVTPSAEDIRITKQMVEAGRILDIRVLDHVVLGRSSSADAKSFLSIREAGLVEFPG